MARRYVALCYLLGLGILLITACTGVDRHPSATGTGSGEIAVNAAPSPTPHAAAPPGSGMASQPGGRHTPVAEDVGAQRFLQTHFVGERPFQDVAQYADWLVNKPGVAAVKIASTGTADGATLGHITIISGDGSQHTAECLAGGSTTDPRGILWQRCPQLAALWLVGSPPNFPSLQAARPYLPYDVLMPPSLPGGYQLGEIALPAAGSAASNLFVVTGIYTASDGSRLTLEEQPAGLNGPVFTDFGTCPAQRSQPIPDGTLPIVFGTVSAGVQHPLSCAAWADKAIWFFMTGDPATTPLEPAVQAIEAL